MDATLEEAELGQVVIFGFGRVGRLVADMLDAHGKDYLAIDSDVDAVAARASEGYDVLFGDVVAARTDRAAGNARAQRASS